MNIFETFKLAFKSIIANRLRSSLTILGIVIGVTSVILLVALVSGLKSFITAQISSFGANVMYVIPGRIGGGRGPGGSQANRLTYQDANNLRVALGGDAEVSASIQRTSTLKYQNKTDRDVTIAGVEATYFKIISALKIDKGRFFTFSEANSGKRVVVIGPTVVKNLFGGRDPIGEYISVGNLKYQVIGVVGPRGANFGIDLDNVGAISVVAAQRQFGEDRVQNILISAKTPELIKSVQSEAVKTLKKRLTEDDFTVQTQEQTLSTISQITGVLTAALGGIAAISLIVGIGIMNIIMLVSVTERTREIGLRKALGARPKDIRLQFLIEAVTLSALGGIIGIILGIAFSLLVNIFFQTTITWWSIALSFGFSVLVGVVFGVAPALRASKMNPIQALRYE